MIKSGDKGPCSAPDCPHAGELVAIWDPTRMLCGTCYMRDYRKTKKRVEAARMYNLSLDPSKLTANQYDAVLGALVANINSLNKTLKLEYLPRIIRTAVIDMLTELRGLEKSIPTYTAPAPVMQEAEKTDDLDPLEEFEQQVIHPDPAIQQEIKEELPVVNGKVQEGDLIFVPERPQAEPEQETATTVVVEADVPIANYTPEVEVVPVRITGYKKHRGPLSKEEKLYEDMTLPEKNQVNAFQENGFNFKEAVARTLEMQPKQ